MINSFILIFILIFAFIFAGIPIIIAKKRYQTSQIAAARAKSQKPGPSSVPFDSSDPNQFFVSGWGWMTRQLSSDPAAVLALTCTFNGTVSGNSPLSVYEGPSTVTCTFPGSTDTLIFKLNTSSSGVTTVIAGTRITVAGVVSSMNKAEYSKYSHVTQGDQETTCNYYYVPPLGDTTLGVPRRQLILNKDFPLIKLDYIPPCIEPNVIDGQAHIRSCMGTILFGSRYQSIPQCIDSKGIRRNAGYTESYVSSCAANDKINACDSSKQLVYLSLAPNSDTQPDTDDAMTIYILNEVIPEQNDASIFSTSVLKFTMTAVNGPPSLFFEAGYYDNTLNSSSRGINIALNSQASQKYVLVVDKDTPNDPLDLIFVEKSLAANFGICWRSLDTSVMANQAVYSGTHTVTDPQWTLIDVTKFKSSIENFHTVLQGISPSDWLRPITDSYNTLIQTKKIYTSGQGILDIIVAIIKGFSLKQGDSGSVTIAPINNLYDAFQTLFYLYYNCVKVNGPSQLRNIDNFYNEFNTEFIGVLSVTMIDPNANKLNNVKTMVNTAITNPAGLIRQLTDMYLSYPDERFRAIRTVMQQISEIPTNNSLTALGYMQHVISKIPQYSTTIQSTFSENWILFRTALVSTGTLLTSDKNLYIKARDPIEQYEQKILELIVQVQGYADVVSYMPGGLVYCKFIQEIPLIPSDIINWITTNHTTKPVYRVYRSGATGFGIEQLNVTYSTYFGLSDYTSTPLISTTSMEMNTVLGINSTSQGHII